MSKTPLMLKAEKRCGQPLEKFILWLINKKGFSQAEIARKLGVRESVLSYWLLQFRIRVLRVALGPKDTLEIRSSTPRR